MMKIKKRIRCLSLPLVLLVLLFGCSREEQEVIPSGNSIKIGIIGPMSGPRQALGKEGVEGIETALIMQPYLDNGDTVKLVVEDDKNKPELTVQAFKKLTETDKVSAVLLLSTSASALAVNAIADSYQVPVLVLLATHSDISKETQFVNQVCFDNIFQGKVAALYVRDELLIDRVAVFKNPDSFYSSSLANEFIRKFSSIDGDVVEVVSVTDGSVNYDDLLTRLAAKKVQLLYLPLDAESVVNVSKSLQRTGWAPTLMGGDSLLTNILDLDNAASHEFDGFLTTDLYSSNIEMAKYAKKVGKVFRSRFETRDSIYPAVGYEGMALLQNAINRCQGSPDSGCINRQVRDTVGFEGIMGKITILPNGKVMRPLIVNRIHGNRMEFAVKVY